MGTLYLCLGKFDTQQKDLAQSDHRQKIFAWELLMYLSTISNYCLKFFARELSMYLSIIPIKQYGVKDYSFLELLGGGAQTPPERQWDSDMP